MTPKDLALAIARLLDEKKATDVQVLDIAHLTVIADCFVIASGRSNLQVRALCDEVEQKAAQLDAPLLRRDGASEGKWTVLDYGSVIVHIFHETERAFYNIERLWTDGSNTINMST